MESKTFTIKTLGDWDACAVEIVPLLVPGMIVTLSGPLGAGKTTFTQALAYVLGTKTAPRSPTFSLMRTYALSGQNGLKRLIHIDAYRLEKPSDVLALNLDEECAEPGTLVVIEWPENMKEWLKRPGLYLNITIQLGNDQERTVTYT